MSLIKLAQTIFLMLCATACVCGCLPATSETEDRLEHQIPAHRPNTFGDGIRQLRPRLAKLVEPSSIATEAEMEQQITELIDIVNWLPVLAAESPLEKRDWEQAKSLSDSLQIAFGAQKSSARTPWQTTLEQVDSTIRKLEELIPSSEEIRDVTAKSS